MASNLVFSGSGPDELVFTRAIGHLVLHVTTASIELSFDGGDTALTVPTGFYDFPVGIMKVLTIGGTGTWSILAIQA